MLFRSAKNRWRYGKMEFDNPSRFIDEIDSKLIDSQDEAGGSLFGSRADSSSDQPEWARAQRPRRPWEDAGQPRYSSRYQNSKPVTSAIFSPPIDKPAAIKNLVPPPKGYRLAFTLKVVRSNEPSA